MSLPGQNVSPDSMIDRDEILRTIYEPIKSEMKEIEARLVTELDHPSRAVRSLVSHVSRYRGKRLRPALAQLTGKACGRCDESHIVVGITVELIHNASLVHDDILDEATTRRGMTTLNAEHGADVPVLLGDFIYCRAFALSTMLEDSTLSRELARAAQETCCGEIDQIFARGRMDLSEEPYLKMIEGKTAMLYATAAHLGAHYAGAPKNVCSGFAEFGTSLGIAFQIIDDCLDLTGDEPVVGKSLGTDLEKGKMTLPLIHLYGTLRSEKRREFEELLQSNGVEKRSALLERFDLGPSLAYAHDKADRLTRRALASLPNLEPSPSLDSLRRIGRYVLERSR